MLKFGSALAPTGVVQLGSECHTAQQSHSKDLLGRKTPGAWLLCTEEGTELTHGFLGTRRTFQGHLGLVGFQALVLGSSHGQGVFLWLFSPHIICSFGHGREAVVTCRGP